MTEYAEFEKLARTIAAEAGDLIARRRQGDIEVAESKSAPEDIVTAADRESEALIRERVAAARPDDAFLGEETGAAPGSSGITWVVDPIDGTVNYLYNIPEFNVSIGVVEGEPDPATWRALAGVVVNPSRNEIFSASLGAGATLNGRPITVNRGVRPALALVGTGFSYSSARRVWQAGVVTKLISHVRDIRRFGSAALDLCYVAAGRIDAYYERGLNPWDMAAGSLIAAEAGARVGGLHGTPAQKNFTLVADAQLFEELHDLLIAAGADEEG
ncbi:inositol monophosphatase family protein [Okibacterium endophyticum]